MSKSFIYLFLIFSSFLLVNCSYFQQTNNKQAIAKAGNAYLYAEDLPDLPTQIQSKEDSLVNLQRFIDKWALEKLLLDKAKFNLSKKQQENFDQMAEQYRIQLYINAYKDAFIETNSTASFSDEEIEVYYEEKKQNFKLKETLLKLRYLVIKSDLKDVDQIQQRFTDFTKEDQAYLQSKSLEFKALMLNDSVWIRLVDVKKQLPSIQEALSKHLSNGVQKPGVFQDSIFTYLVDVREVLTPNEVPPISYLKPTLKQILENKRKLELNKQLEKDIINDAIQNNEYETY